MDATPGGWAEGWDALDAAVTRLEEYLHSLSYDRALPDLPVILAAADITIDVLREDERARKLLHEAIRARPLATRESVQRRSIEVELLTLEVSVLTSAMTAAAAPDADETALLEGKRAAERLAWIRHRLTELRREL